MKLQGRNLSLNLRGRDVALLHRELRQIGLVIPDDELRAALYGRVTFRVVAEFQKKNGLEANGVVDEKSAAVINRNVALETPRIVKGLVTDENGNPLVNLSVSASDKDLRREEPLGQAVTGKNGRYEIAYKSAQFQRAEKNSADLIVRVTSREKLLATSDVVFNAQPEEEVDFQIATSEGLVPEFERYLTAMRPILEDVLPSMLTADDIDFVAGEAGIPQIHVGYLVVAHQMGQMTKLNPELLYGLFRQDLPTELSALVLEQPTAIRQALETSLQNGVVNQQVAGQIDSLLTSIQDQRVTLLSTGSGDKPQNNISAVLNTSGLNATEQQTFLNSYLKHEGTVEEFWRSLQTTPLATRVGTIQERLQLEVITHGNAPLIQKLRSRNVRSLRDLPTLDRDELQKLVGSSTDILAAIPPVNVDETAEQKAKRYVDDLYKTLHATIPTAFVAAAYERSADPVLKDVARVLTNNPNLDLIDLPLNQFLDDNQHVLDGASDKEAVKARLKKTQRVMRVANQADHAEALLAKGLDSAQAIVSLSPDDFEEQFAEKLGGPTQARAYHNRATQITESLVGVMAAVKQGMSSALPAVIAPVPNTVKELPNFTTLFGSQSLCACKDCNSVLSPAAYLVDLLEMINPKSGPKPIEKLRQRRPDIEHIPLTCENTNTELPYVDLVNEILEFYVAHNQTLSPQAAHDTMGTTAEELSINSQYVIAGAYETLAQAVYPLDLPFDRSLAIARLYLNHLGTTRYQLMNVFRKGGLPTEAEVHLEGLEISSSEAGILRGDLNRPLSDYYGSSVDLSSLTEISVAEFLRRTGVSYDDLTQLLIVQTLNPDGSVKLEDSDNPPRCNPDKILLKNLTSEFWQKAHRIIRLSKKTGWSFAELDVAFRSLNENDITQELLRKLSEAKQLKAELKVSLEVLFSFWSDLDVVRPNSLYAQLFLNKAVFSPLDRAFDVNALSGSTALLKDHTPELCAALRIGVDDLEAICRHLNLPSDQTTLGLSSLSALHRHAALARALKLKVDDLLSLLILSGKDPFAVAEPASTIAFVEIASAVKESGFKVSELNYLYRHLSDPKNPMGLSDESINGVINTIHAGLKGIVEQSSQAPDPTVDPLRPPLVKVVGEDLVDQAIAVVYGTAELTEAQRGEFIDKHFALFLNPVEARAVLFNPDTTQDQKQVYVKNRVLEYEQKGSVTQVLSETLKLESGTAGIVIERIVKSKTDPSRRSLDDFLALSSVPVEVMKGQVADPAAAIIIETTRKALIHLRKVSLLLSGFEMSENELAHLSLHADAFNDFDLNALPLEEGAFDASLFADWFRLASYAAFARSVPQRDSDLITVFSSAYLPPAENPREKAIEELKKATAWDSHEVDFLVGSNGLNLASADDFKNEDKLRFLYGCIRLGNRLGVSCERLFDWSASGPSSTIANEVVAAAKSKYSHEQWLLIAKPLNDTLREAQKAALLSAILTSKKSQTLGLTDSSKLFEHFLIDVDMSACGKTSRVKQAISSVQLFIQRCLMNMESGVSPSAIDSDHWQWMKNYRVWEANRKIFLYPENWIEPELRDDKSPFFKQLETELLQNDLTLDAAEQAFAHYLEKLDEVSHLEICGHYKQTAENGEDEVTHVFGRTTAQPHIYFYRRFIDNRTWTAWEKLEMDIEGDHIFPVVHNRRLYLFWLQFAEIQNRNQELPAAYLQSMEHWRWLTRERPDWMANHQAWLKEHDIREIWKSIESVLKAAQESDDFRADVLGKFIESFGVDPTTEEPSEPREPEEPPFTTLPALTHWEIRLAWSEYQYGRWSARKTSSEPIESSYVAKSLQSFFWEHAGLAGALALGELNSQYQLMRTKEDGTLEETFFTVFLPDKESHFVRTSVDADTGHLIVGAYRRYAHAESVLGLVDLTVKGFETVGRFELHCGNKVDAANRRSKRDYDSLQRPDGSTNSNLCFKHDSGSKLTFSSDGKARDVLKKVPSGRYSILGQHQNRAFRLKPPYQDFFYQDAGKVYYATYQSEAPVKIAGNPARALLPAIKTKHSALVDSLTKNSAVTTRSLQLTGSSARKVIRIPAGATSPVMEQIDTDSDPLNGSPELSESKLMTDTTHDSLLGALSFADEGLRFTTFFHPHVCEFVERLYEDGLTGLLKRSTQQLDNDKDGAVFAKRYDPSGEVAFPYPKEDVDFENGPCAIYNWELFFHIPIFIAISLCKNQRFEDAVQWFHFVFNPTTSEKATGNHPLQRFWKALPLYENTDPEKDQIQELLLNLAGKKSNWKKIQDQIDDWRNDPFNPHLIARMRITAYQKNVVMKYIENLIAWGDQLFSRDTLESINEATSLYALAGNILGPRPQIYPAGNSTAPKTYSDIAGDLDAFSNLLVDLENELPAITYKKSVSWAVKSNKSLKLKHKNHSIKNIPAGAIAKSAVQTLHFCVPDNENMLTCWDTVADRLFKIRHCMNIEGAVRELPLFEPPIDPALLVKARAAGIDLSSVMNDLFAPLPRYRFSLLAQKALDLCNELKSLGSALLSVLEKKDSEELSSIRARQETAMLRLARQVKQLQIDEQKASIEALNRTRAVTETRYNYYRDVAEINANEQEHMDQLETAQQFSLASQGLAAAVPLAHMMPDFHTGAAGFSSPFAVLKWGGANLGNALQSASAIVGMVSSIHSHEAQMASIKGGYDRRWDDWKLSEKLASQELSQIERQIVAAEIRQAIAEQELQNHDQQLENNLEVEEYLRSKYTNEDLYTWMISQVSKVYFQSYNLAYDLAKRAERAYRFELGLRNSNFIQFGYWDSLKKGLLAGEQLALDLKRMDTAYLDQNKREYEITRHVSLMFQEPLALMALKETGKCNVKLPESLFDADYPGHYMRRIKSVSLTIPCVVGPYTSINCTLTLLSNRARTTATPVQPYRKDPNDLDDDRFSLSFAAQQSIATSHAQNDSGLFELNFRDERYLPFEGAGAISEWQIELPKTTNAFDFNSISDVVLHLKYTARDGGESLRTAAREDRKQVIHDAALSPLARLFSLKAEFPTDWYRFLHPDEPQAGQEYLHKIAVDLTMERFPFLFRGEQLELNSTTLFLKLRPGFTYDDGTRLSLMLNQSPVDLLKQGSPTGDLPSVTRPLNGASVPFPFEIEVVGSSLPSATANETSWWEAIEINNENQVRLRSQAIEDIWLLFHYSVVD
jgi:hypothetical protein